MSSVPDTIPSQNSKLTKGELSMVKFHRIIQGTILVAVFGFLMIILAYGKSTPAVTHGGTDSVTAVQLRFIFEGGDTANVTEIEGGTIKVEKEGKKLTITPFRRDHGQVELRVSQAVQREGKEVMEAL